MSKLNSGALGKALLTIVFPLKTETEKNGFLFPQHSFRCALRFYCAISRTRKRIHRQAQFLKGKFTNAAKHTTNWLLLQADATLPSQQPRGRENIFLEHAAGPRQAKVLHLHLFFLSYSSTESYQLGLILRSGLFKMSFKFRTTVLADCGQFRGRSM